MGKVMAWWENWVQCGQPMRKRGRRSARMTNSIFMDYYIIIIVIIIIIMVCRAIMSPPPVPPPIMVTWSQNRVFR